MIKLTARLLTAASALTMAACASTTDVATPAPIVRATAPGAPGDKPTWVSAVKTGAGSSYEAYVDGQFRPGGPTGDVSKVWFSIADGVLTETMYGLIHEAQIKQMRFAVATPSGLAIEGEDTTARTEYLHTDASGRPLSPAYRVTTTDRQGRFEIEKQLFTDPDRNAMVVRVTVRALSADVTPHLLLEPHIANTGVNDLGQASAQRLYAHEGSTHLVLKPSQDF